MEKLVAAIVIVSSGCYRGTDTDRTAPALEKFLEGHEWLSIESVDIVDDNKAMIQDIIERITRDAAVAPNLVLLSGGTGFTRLDVTPEAVKPLFTKEAPSLVFAMLNHSLKITPYAMCSRPAAGMINETLVITLPGSPKGATENLDAIINMLQHILRQLKVDSARELHRPKSHPSSGAESSSHSHSHLHGHFHDLSHANSHDHGLSHHSDHGNPHGHGHNVQHHILSNSLGGPVSRRARKSPYRMIPVPEALDLINQYTPAPTVIEKLITDGDITGYVLAEDIYAKVNVPDFDASIVDGYAVIHTDCPGSYAVVSVSHAAPGEAKKLTSGKIVRVTTGAPIPLGTTAVIPVEETELVFEKDDGEEKEVRILAMNVTPGDNIRKSGSDIAKGTLALSQGKRISSIGGEIGLLASIGVLKIKVYKKPIIGVLSTGDELVDLDTANLDEPLRYGQIYDTNRPLLKQLFKGSGFDVRDLGIANDKLGNLGERIKSQLDDIDYIITSGGVSMGEMDLLKPFIEQDLLGTIHFGRVAMKPGKPTTFATFHENHKYHGKVIFSLPGNPASCSVTSHLFVIPSLLKFSGVVNLRMPEQLPSLSVVDVILKQEAKLDPRPEYQRVYIHQEGVHLTAESTGFQRSSRIGSVAGANGLLILPSSSDSPSNVLSKGSKVKAMVIDML
jgi:gephyrin